MFNGNSMVPHYQQVGGAAGFVFRLKSGSESERVFIFTSFSAPPPLDCAQLSLSNFPQCVENRPSIPTSSSELSCTFEQGTTCRSVAHFSVYQNGINKVTQVTKLEILFRFDASALNIASISDPTTKKAFSTLMGR